MVRETHFSAYTRYGYRVLAACDVVPERARDRLRKMMTHRTGRRDLQAWLAAVEAGDQPDLHSFTAGIRKASLDDSAIASPSHTRQC